jgi:hypothetical protein
MIKNYIKIIDQEDLIPLLSHFFEENLIDTVLIQYLRMFSEKSLISPTNFIFLTNNKNTETVVNKFRIVVLKVFKSVIEVISNNYETQQIKKNVEKGLKIDFIKKFY